MHISLLSNPKNEHTEYHIRSPALLLSQREADLPRTGLEAQKDQAGCSDTHRVTVGTTVEPSSPDPSLHLVHQPHPSPGSHLYFFEKDGVPSPLGLLGTAGGMTRERSKLVY